jgi:hypothetical protein
MKKTHLASFPIFNITANNICVKVSGYWYNTIPLRNIFSRISNGIYFHRIISGEFVETKKMVLMN